MELSRKQILIFLAWMVVVTLANWASGHDVLKAIVTSCTIGLTALGGIHLIEKYHEKR